MGRGRPAKSFSKQQIQNAIDSTRSFTEAARFLNVSYNTFKEYAKLHELWIVGGKNPTGKGIPKAKHTKKRNVFSIIDGSKNGKNLNLTKLRELLIREAILEEKCHRCGMDEKRITDLRAPLKLTFVDGDRKNYKQENLQLICFNCSYLTEGNIVGRKKKYYSDESGQVYEITGEI